MFYKLKLVGGQEGKKESCLTLPQLIGMWVEKVTIGDKDKPAFIEGRVVSGEILPEEKKEKEIKRK